MRYFGKVCFGRSVTGSVVEARLVFQEAGKPDESGAGSAETPTGSFSNPDGSYYDAAENIFTDAQGNGVSMAPADAATLRVAEAGAPAVPEASAAPEAPPAAPEAGRAAAGAEVARDTQAALTEAAGGQQRELLRQALEGRVDTFINPLKLAGKTFGGDVPRDLNFVSDSAKGELRAQILEQLKDFNLADFSRVFDRALEGVLPVDEVKNLAAEMFAVDMLRKVEADFRAKYPHFTAFIEANSNYKLRYKVTLDEFANRAITFSSSPEDFDAKYKTFHDEKEKANPEQTAQQPADPDHDAKVRELSKSWLGGLLVTLGIVDKDDEGNPKFDEVVGGRNWFAGIIVGLFGGSHLLSDSKAYDEMVANLDPKYKVMLDGIQEKARKSPFAFKKKDLKPVVDSGEGKPEKQTGAEERYVDVDVARFEGLVAGSEQMPDRGVRLKAIYNVPDGKVLQTDLGGAELIVAKGTTLHLDGEVDRVARAADISIKDSRLRIKGSIPKGTVFKGKPTFELV